MQTLRIRVWREQRWLVVVQEAAFAEESDLVGEREFHVRLSWQHPSSPSWSPAGNDSNQLAGYLCTA